MRLFLSCRSVVSDIDVEQTRIIIIIGRNRRRGYRVCGRRRRPTDRLFLMSAEVLHHVILPYKTLATMVASKGFAVRVQAHVSPKV